ncbi:hypothetical protein M2347_001284 [Chryseobacterium sp. H1D6B]|nr:hypothetical protein [Chryseobacterium sp. H1D6B]
MFNKSNEIVTDFLSGCIKKNIVKTHKRPAKTVFYTF